MLPGRWLGIARSTRDEFTYHIVPEHKDKHRSIPIMHSIIQACTPDNALPNSSVPCPPPGNNSINPTDADDDNLTTATPRVTVDSLMQSHIDPDEEPPTLDMTQDGSAPDDSDDNWDFDDGLRAFLDQNQGT